MVLALRHRQSGKYYTAKMQFDYKHHLRYLETIDRCKLFKDIDALQSHFEAKIMYFNLDINDVEAIQHSAKITEIAKEFDIVIIEQTFQDESKIYNVSFYSVLKDLIIFHMINASYENNFAKLIRNMQIAKSMKNYIIKIPAAEAAINIRMSNLPTLEDIKSTLGDDLIYKDLGLRFNNKIYICTNDKSDINLLKLCFNIKDIFFIETESLNSLL